MRNLIQQQKKECERSGPFVCEIWIELKREWVKLALCQCLQYSVCSILIGLPFQLFHSCLSYFVVVVVFFALAIFFLFFKNGLFCAFCVLSFWNERVQVFFNRKHGVLHKLFYAFPRHFVKQVYWNVYTTNKCETRTTTTEWKKSKQQTNYIQI